MVSPWASCGLDCALVNKAEVNWQSHKKRMGWLVKGRRPSFGLAEPNIWSGCEKRE